MENNKKASTISYIVVKKNNEHKYAIKIKLKKPTNLVNNSFLDVLIKTFNLEKNINNNNFLEKIKTYTPCKNFELLGKIYFKINKK